MKNLKRESQPSRRETHREPDPLLTPEQRERQRLAAALVREWSKEEDGYDEEIWPLIEEEFGWKK
jgi:hypothetical protein